MQHMQHDFHMRDFENVIIYRKICDMRVLPKYVITYVIAYLHITSIPNCRRLHCNLVMY